MKKYDKVDEVNDLRLVEICFNIVFVSYYLDMYKWFKKRKENTMKNQFYEVTCRKVTMEHWCSENTLLDLIMRDSKKRYELNWKPDLTPDKLLRDMKTYFNNLKWSITFCCFQIEAILWKTLKSFFMAT